MQLLGYPGVILHPYGESGGQKSAGMEVAAAVWASAAQIPTLNETDNRINMMLGYLKNLPSYFDELTSDNRDLVALAMSISGGRTKGRLKRSAELAETLTYSTMLICASNHPIHSVIEDNQRTTTAGLNRVFEWEVPKVNIKAVSTTSRTDAQALLGALGHNYGHTGDTFAQFFGKNIPNIRERVLKTSSAIDKAVQGSDYDRFWIAGVTCLIVGAQIGVELKVWNMDVDQLCGFLIKTLMHLQGKRDASTTDLTKAVNAERYLAEYLAAHRSQMVLTNRIQRRRGPVPAGFITNIHNPDLQIGRPITIRVARDDNLIRISMRDFGQWLKRDGLHRGEIVDAILKRVPAVTREYSSLIVGTHHKGPDREDVLEIDLTRMPPDWFAF